jgi:hypothetical protein
MCVCVSDVTLRLRTLRWRQIGIRSGVVVLLWIVLTRHVTTPRGMSVTCHRTAPGTCDDISVNTALKSVGHVS